MKKTNKIEGKGIGETVQVFKAYGHYEGYQIDGNEKILSWKVYATREEIAEWLKKLNTEASLNCLSQLS